MLAFATSIASFVWLQANKDPAQPNTLFTGYYNDPSTARTLNVVYISTFWVGVAVAAGGVAEAIYSARE